MSSYASILREFEHIVRVCPVCENELTRPAPSDPWECHSCSWRDHVTSEARGILLFDPERIKKWALDGLNQ